MKRMAEIVFKEEEMKKANLFCRLDKGIEDMEEGRERSVSDAFREISALREAWRNAGV